MNFRVFFLAVLHQHLSWRLLLIPLLWGALFQAYKHPETIRSHGYNGQTPHAYATWALPPGSLFPA